MPVQFSPVQSPTERNMKCFHFSYGDKRSGGSRCSTARRCGGASSELNSISDLSWEYGPPEGIGVEQPFTTTSLSQKSNNLRSFTFSELKIATKNFSRSLVVGEGGFGCVYRGIIKAHDDPPQSKLTVAVKQLGKRGLQGHKEWVTEVNVLGVVHHPNLVKLIGYCADDDERGIQRLLIYEYMPNLSVQDHLSPKSSTHLPWPLRLQIAQDAARGLAYLHEEMDFQIIFRDFKTSNILLDEQWNAKLSDFGLARLGPAEGLSHVSTAVVGTMGYAAPEYMQTGRLTAKSDVWSYGVFLYELLTGRQPMDKNRPRGEQKLLEWIRPYLSDMKKFKLILDPRLEGEYSVKSVQRIAAVANRCLVRNPKSRPKMSEVLEMVKQIAESPEVGKLKHPTKSPNGVPVLEKNSESNLKRKNGDDGSIESSWSAWRSWAPKLVRAC